MVREQFIEAAKEQFGERLLRKKNKSMDSYYLDKVRKGRGVFWIDHEESGKMGYRVHLQKIKSICDEIQGRGWGGYPLVLLSGLSEVNDILGKVREIISDFDERDKKKERLGSVKSFAEKGRIRGIVTAQICKHCSHHEIGIVTEQGRYVALKPGMRIELIEIIK